MAEISKQIEDKVIESAPLNSGGGLVQNFSELSTGGGSTQFRANKEGVFIGGNDFQSAPWTVDYTGVQTVGPNSEIVIDGPNGTVTTNKIIDSTYGFYGCFVKCFTTTATTGQTDFTVAPQNGGLVHIAVNMADTGSPASFIDVPSYNFISVDWECFISGGNYIVRVYNANIHNDYFPLTKVYVTVFFNSLETAGF